MQKHKVVVKKYEFTFQWWRNAQGEARSVGHGSEVRRMSLDLRRRRNPEAGWILHTGDEDNKDSSRIWAKVDNHEPGTKMRRDRAGREMAAKQRKSVQKGVTV